VALKFDRLEDPPGELARELGRMMTFIRSNYLVVLLLVSSNGAARAPKAKC